MCEVAAHLTDHVLPHLPARQWVLSVPKRLRPYLQHDTRVAGAVLRIFLRAIRFTLRGASPGAPSGTQLGAVSFFHRSAPPSTSTPTTAGIGATHLPAPPAQPAPITPPSPALSSHLPPGGPLIEWEGLEDEIGELSA